MSAGRSYARGLILTILLCALAACGGRRDTSVAEVQETRERASTQREAARLVADENGPNRPGFFSLFTNIDDPNTTLEVNRYIWNAALEILDFMPVEAADPFSGVIVMGFGTPPGGGRAYRATVYVQDPALDARSLNVALQSRGGPADADTVRAVEDAILTRARQLRIRDTGL